MLKEELIQRRKLFFGRVVYFGWPNQHASGIMVNLNWKFMYGNFLRTFALIVCAQPFCAGNATVICHASLRLTGPEDKHGVENAGEKISGRVYSFGSSVTPTFLIMNHLLYLLSTKYDKMKKISP